MSKTCNISQTCSCGAKLEFRETLPVGSWPHEHKCDDAQREFIKLHAKCMTAPSNSIRKPR